MATTPRTRTAIGGAAALLLITGGVGVAASASGTSSTETTPTSLVTPVPGEVPAPFESARAEGQTVDTQLVIGHDGQPAGYLEEANPIGDEPLQLAASETAFRGLVVRSERDGGEIVGYLLTGDPGFVSVDDLADPATLAQIEQVWATDQEASQGGLPPEVGEAVDQYESQLQRD